MAIRTDVKSVKTIRKSLSTTARNAQDELSPQGVSEADSGFTNLPLITERQVTCAPYLEKPQAWVETLSTIEDTKLGIVDLHPDVFATFPRIDLLHKNIHWQQMYKKVNLAKTKRRSEVRGTGKKPFPQKGRGKARHGSLRAPQWIGGGKAIGPTGLKTYWYVLPSEVRSRGLRVALTIKHAQDDLHIVDSLDIPSSDPQYLEDVGKERYWDESVLFVDHKPVDELPENFLEAIDRIKSYSITDTEGINVYSMLKYRTLVLTLDAVNFLEDRLLHLMKEYKNPKKKQEMVIVKSQLGMNVHRNDNDLKKELLNEER